MANLVIWTINLWNCVISAKRSKIEGWQTNMRTLSWSMVSQFKYKKFKYEFNCDITVQQANSLYDLCSSPFQTVTYRKDGWSINAWKVCYVDVTDEDDDELWKYQPLSLSASQRYVTVKISVEEQ